VQQRSELNAWSSSNHLLCRSTASCSNPAEY